MGGDGKPKLNYDKVVELYNKYQNIREVARQLNVERTIIQDILHSRNIPILPAALVT